MVNIKKISARDIKMKFSDTVNKCGFLALLERSKIDTSKMNPVEVINSVYNFARSQTRNKFSEIDGHEVYKKYNTIATATEMNKLLYSVNVDIYHEIGDTEKADAVRKIDGVEHHFLLTYLTSIHFAVSKEQMERIKKCGNELCYLVDKQKSIFTTVLAELLLQSKRMRFCISHSSTEPLLMIFSKFYPKMDQKESKALKEIIYQQHSNKPKYFLQQLLNKDATTQFLNNQYINYSINKTASTFRELVKTKNCQYVKENFHPDSCLLTAVINHFQTTLKERYQKDLSYKMLAEWCNIEYQKSNMSCSIEMMMPFFDKYKLPIVLYNKDMLLLYKINEDAHSSISAMHLIIHAQHCYLLNENINSLSKKTCKKYELATVPKEKNSNIAFPVPKLYERELKIFLIDTMSEMRKKIQQISTESLDLKTDDDIRVKFVSTRVKELFIQCLKNGFKPNVIFESNNLKSFTFQIKIDEKSNIKLNVNVQYPIEEIDESYTEVETVEQYHLLQELNAELRYTLMNKEYIGYKHPSVRTVENLYKISPLCFKLQEQEAEKLTALDMNKAYSTVVRNHLKEIPVFDYFDVYEKYDNHEIEDLTQYIVEGQHALLQQRVSRCYGFILKEIIKKYSMGKDAVTEVESIEDFITQSTKSMSKAQKQCKILKKTINDITGFNILQFRRPRKIVSCDFSSIIDKVYASELPEKLKKNICNISIGCLGRKNIYRGKSYIYEDTIEADFQCQYYGNSEKHEIEYEENGEQKNIYIVNIGRERKLKNDFSHVNELIVSIENLLIYRTFKKVQLLGFDVQGIRTDCVLYNDKMNDLLIDEINIKDHFKIGRSIGEFKIEKNKCTVGLPFLIEENKYIPEIFNDITISKKYFFTPEEEFDSECKKQMEIIKTENQNVFIAGEFAGVGKSYVAKMVSKNILFVSPNNKLCQSTIISDKIDACTSHRLLGYGANGSSITNQLNVSKYDTIVYDELLLIDSVMRRNLAMFMEEHSEIRFIGTGDLNQLLPIADRQKRTEDDEYRMKAINIMFPVHLNLRKVKRGRTEKDNKDFERFKDICFEAKLDEIFEILKKEFNIKTIHNISQLKTRTNLCYYNRTRKVVNNQILEQDNRVGTTMYETCKVNDKIISIGYYKTSKYKIKTNLEYIITKKEKEIISIANVEEQDEILEIPRKVFEEKFTYPYCNTVDSLQGVTIDEPTTIFDIQSPYVDSKYIYVMLTRLKSFDDITFFEYTKEKVDELYVRKYHADITRKFENNIEYHVDSDMQKRYKWKKEDYVSVAWIKETLKKQDCRCALSGNFMRLEDVSIDRKCSDLPHTKDNCQLVLFHENCSKSNKDLDVFE